MNGEARIVLHGINEATKMEWKEDADNVSFQYLKKITVSEGAKLCRNHAIGMRYRQNPIWKNALSKNW